MANCPKCGKTKLNKNAAGEYYCRRDGARARPPIVDYAPVPEHLKKKMGTQI